MSNKARLSWTGGGAANWEVEYEHRVSHQEWNKIGSFYNPFILRSFISSTYSFTLRDYVVWAIIIGRSS